MRIERFILPGVVLFASHVLTAQTTITIPIDQQLPFGPNAVALPTPQPQNMTSPRVVQMLVGELARPNLTRERRAELAADLAATELPEAGMALADLAGDADPVVRTTVARGLGTFSGDAIASALVKLAADADPVVRAAAVRSAATLKRGDLITAGLNDADASVVTAALDVATVDQAPGVVARLSAEDPSTRAGAIRAVGRIGATASADAVAAHVASPSVAVATAALDALGQLKATGQASKVLDGLKHDHPTVRRSAIAALAGVLAPDDARTRGIAMLADPDESVRTAAALMLAKVPGPAAIAGLVKQLSDPYVPLHAAARAALVATGEPITDAAVALLNHTDARRREDGSYLLGVLKSRAAFDRHVALLDDADWVLVGQVARSLKDIADPTAAPALVKAAERATSGSGAAEQMVDAHAAATDAIVAATTLGHAPSATTFAKFIPDKLAMSSNVRAAAIWSVGRLGAPNADQIFSRFPSLMGDIEEGGDVKMEVVKAVGNLKHAKSVGVLEGSPELLGSSETAAIAHWAGDRIKGVATPFEIANAPWRADVSITDIGE